MNRRTTLGEVSQASMNSRIAGKPRSSMAPPKRMSVAANSRTNQNISKLPARSSTINVTRSSLGPARQSIAPSANGRKSSVGLKRSSAYGAAGTKNDPRPFMERKYINESIIALVEYLSENGYDQPISAKLLTRPSGRDFNNIMGFLFCQYDPAWMPNPGSRFEDEVVPFLKAIGYPYALSKSSLQAVGAPQTWPKALAAISWMVELLSYDNEVRAYEAQQQDKRAAGDTDGIADQALDDKAFFEYLGNAYRCFLDGDDEGYNALESDLITSFQAQTDKIKSEVDAYQAENNALRSETEQVLSKAGTLPDLLQHQKDRHRDLEKFHVHIEQLLVHKKSLEEKVEARSTDENRFKSDLAIVKEQILVLRDRISNQELSAEDVHRMSLERKRLKDGMQATTELKNANQKKYWEAEVQMNKHLEALENAVHAYSSKASALQLIPQTAKNAKGQNFEVAVIRENLENGETLLTNDVRGFIRPSLVAMKDAVVRRASDARIQLLAVLDVLELSEAQLSELVDQTANLDSQLEQLKETYNSEKEALDKQAAEKTAAKSALERQLSALRDPGTIVQRMEIAENKAQNLKTNLDEFRKQWKTECDCLNIGLIETLRLLSDHKVMVHKTIEEVKEHILENIDDVEGNELMKELYELTQNFDV